MADYITADDIVETYGQDVLNKIASAPGSTTADPVLVQKGIDAASGIIDMYLGGRYTLPLINVPQGLTDLAVDIAVYKIPLGRAARTTEMRVRYDDALLLLDKMAKGTISLGLTAALLTANGDASDQSLNLGRSITTFRG